MDGSYLTRKYSGSPSPVRAGHVRAPPPPAWTPAAQRPRHWLVKVISPAGAGGSPAGGRLGSPTKPQPGQRASEPSSATYVDSAALEELLTAVRSDLAAGRLGVRYLLDDQARQENCYLSDLMSCLGVPARRTHRRRGGGRLHGLHHPPVRGPAHPGRTPGLRSGRHAGHPGPDSEGGRRLRDLQSLPNYGRRGSDRPGGSGKLPEPPRF